MQVQMYVQIFKTNPRSQQPSSCAGRRPLGLKQAEPLLAHFEPKDFVLSQNGYGGASCAQDGPQT
eukprot:1644696-Karenia_brevis.AAC.1